jgi:hypothetical protein
MPEQIQIENRWDRAGRALFDANVAAREITVAAEALREACEKFEALAQTALVAASDEPKICKPLHTLDNLSATIRLKLRECSAASFCVTAAPRLEKAWQSLP